MPTYSLGSVIFTVPDDADLTIPPAAQEAER